MAKQIVVIGGGIIGLSSAWKLAEAGHSVTVLEKGKCGDGATTASLGALVPYNASREDSLPSKQRQSLWVYPQFVNDLHKLTGIDVGFKQTGRIQLIQNEHQRNKMQQDADIANEKWPFESDETQKLLNEAELKKLEPEVEGTNFGALHCKATATFEPKRMIAALRSACMKMGVDIREHSPAVQFITQPSHVSQVHTATGLVSADFVVLAAGAWSKNILPADHPLQQTGYVAPLKGQALEVATSHQLINHMVRGLGVYLIQVDDKKLLIGGTKEKDAGFDTATTQKAEDDLLAKAEKLVPAIAECKVVRQWAGLRPYSEQKAPFIGWDSAFENLYHATGHAGIGLCLTPYTCQKVLKDIEHASHH